jgi:uncharacterized tellurite resistance protein B-like protein
LAVDPGIEKRYSKQELQQFKDLLDHKLMIAKEELESLTASLGQAHMDCSKLIWRMVLQI